MGTRTLGCCTFWSVLGTRAHWEVQRSAVRTSRPSRPPKPCSGSAWQHFWWTTLLLTCGLSKDAPQAPANNSNWNARFPAAWCLVSPRHWAKCSSGAPQDPEIHFRPMYCDTERHWLVGLLTCALKTLKPGPDQLPLHHGQLDASGGRRCETGTKFRWDYAGRKSHQLPTPARSQPVAHLCCCDRLGPKPQLQRTQDNIAWTVAQTV